MPQLAIPILKQLVPDGFDYGMNLLVEFDSRSIWYETSLTIAARALMDGVRTDYHTFSHYPTEVLQELTKRGLDAERLQEDGTLGIIDSYTAQLGFGPPRKPIGRVHFQTQSLKIPDWSIAYSQEMKEVATPESEKRRLHVDDNTSVLLQYNEEKTAIDWLRTRLVPMARGRELTLLHALLTGVHSEAFYRQLESIVEGIIELRSEEINSGVEHFIRIRTMRGKNYDSRWHKLELLRNGEVALVG